MSAPWNYYICDRFKCVNLEFIQNIEIYSESESEINFPKDLIMFWKEPSENPFSSKGPTLGSKQDLSVNLKNCRTNPLYCTKKHLVGMAQEDVIFIKSKKKPTGNQNIFSTGSFEREDVYLVGEPSSEPVDDFITVEFYEPYPRRKLGVFGEAIVGMSMLMGAKCHGDEKTKKYNSLIF